MCDCTTPSPVEICVGLKFKSHAGMMRSIFAFQALRRSNDLSAVFSYFGEGSMYTEQELGWRQKLDLEEIDFTLVIAISPGSYF